MRMYYKILFISLLVFSCSTKYICIEGDCNNGKGNSTYSDGSKYVGEWKNGKRDGEGTYTFHDGNKYEGEFKEDKRDGEGTYTSQNGDKYVGEWKNGKQDGRGTTTYSYGKKYEGEYLRGKRHGKWMNYSSSGEVKSYYLYKNGEHSGEITCTCYPNGQIESEGKTEWDDNEKKHVKIGKWTYYKEDGSIDRIEEYVNGELIEK